MALKSRLSWQWAIAKMVDPTADCQLSPFPAVGEGVLQLHRVAHYNTRHYAHYGGCSETREDMNMGMAECSRKVSWTSKLKLGL